MRADEKCGDPAVDDSPFRDQRSKSLKRGRVLAYVVERDPERRPLTPEFVEEDFRGFAMRAPGANKDLKVGDRFAGMDPRPARRYQQEKANADRANDGPDAWARTEHNGTLAHRVERGDGSDVGEHVQDLLV